MEEIKYYKVVMDSAYFCGFTTTYYFKGKSEEEIEESQDFTRAIEYMEDYILGHCDEGDFEEYDFPNEVGSYIEECTKEEYEEFYEDNEF